jgi:hypothetical protein
VTQLAVLSGAGREHQAARTISELNGRGAAGRVHLATRELYYSAPAAAAAPELPAGWSVVRREGPRGGGADFRWMVGQLDPTHDALLFEDDVQPCVNAVRAMLQVPLPPGCGAISFYDAGDTIGHLYAGMRSGLAVIGANGPNELGFHGAQALMLPSWLIARMQVGEFDPPHAGQDVWIGRLLDRAGLKIAVCCPSLVQHVGDDSLCSPGATLEGARKPSNNFPGEDFDAAGPWPETITPGPWTPRERITWCDYHGINHADAVACPRLVR